MASIFMSHASVDKPLVDDVKRMIQEAVGLSPTEIFYASSVGSGIPAGKPFVQHMSDEMRGAGFVISIITPAYLESKFCLAELGAVWYAVDKHYYPLCIDVDYDDLRATLLGIQVPRLDDRAVLTDLLQKLCEYAERPHVAAACTDAVEKFLVTLPARRDQLQGPTMVPAAKLAEAERTRDQLGKEVVGLRDQLTEARELFEQAKEAKSLEDIEELELPSETRDWVSSSLARARDAVREVPSIVAQSIPYSLRGEDLPWPTEFADEASQASDAYNSGYLKEGDGGLYPNDEYPDIDRAMKSVKAAQEALDALDGQDLAWFKDTYGVPPDLSQAAAFKRLVD